MDERAFYYLGGGMGENSSAPLLMVTDFVRLTMRCNR